VRCLETLPMDAWCSRRAAWRSHAETSATRILLTLLCYGTVSAEWVRTGGTHKYDAYADLATIGVID